MAIAVLELNDQGLLIQTEGAEVHCQSGFAQLHPQKIDYGEPAKAIAWLQPQSSYNQYWSQLNQSLLPVKYDNARHYADIAFGQLKQLYELAEQPESMIVAVPASFNEQQLSLLLGMLAALPTNVVAVIDNGLASCLSLPNDSTLLVDLQLHQAVLTVCQKVQGELQVVDQQLIPDLGIMTLYNVVAQHISKSLIEQLRYDPLHDSKGEQVIYNQLAGWMKQLSTENELSITIPSPQGELSLLLRKKEICNLLTSRCENLLSSVKNISEKYSGLSLICTHRSKILNEFISDFSNEKITASEVTLTNCFIYVSTLIRCSDPIHCLQSLPLFDEKIKPIDSVSKASVSITHLLYNYQAWSLRKPLSINLMDETLSFSNVENVQADLVLILDDQKINIVRNNSFVDVVFPEQLLPGEMIKIGQYRLELIEVNDG